LVSCVVERIDNTIVFVKIFSEGREIDGSIVVSEIAPGRIRNLRDYVVPKKKIVCKILRISPNGNVELSLRRVTPKEKKEILGKEQQEKSYASIVKNISGEKAAEILKKISADEEISSFFGEARENPKKLEKFFGKGEAEKIMEVLKAQKQKKIILKKDILLKSEDPNGISLIRETLGGLKGVEVRYISAGKYSLKSESADIKDADNKLKEELSKIEKNAKENGLEFSIKER